MDDPHLYMAIIGLAVLITGLLIMLGYLVYMIFIV